MPMNFGPVDNICFFVYIYFFFFSSIEMQDVKNGNMPFNQVKNNREREREKMLVLIMNEVETNSI